MTAIETNCAKIVRRLGAEGWRFLRNGAEHDVYDHPLETGRAYRACGIAFARRRQANREICRLEVKVASYIALIDGKAGAYGV